MNKNIGVCRAFRNLVILYSTIRKQKKAFANGDYEKYLRLNHQLYERFFQSGLRTRDQNEMKMLELLLENAETIKWSFQQNNPGRRMQCM